MAKSPSTHMPPIVDNGNECNCHDRVLILESQFPYLSTKEDISDLRGKFKEDISNLRGDLKILKLWMWFGIIFISMVEIISEVGIPILSKIASLFSVS